MSASVDTIVFTKNVFNYQLKTTSMIGFVWIDIRKFKK